MKLELGQELKLDLTLELAPRLIQMLKILNLAYPELVEKISSEAESNVMLEVEKKDELIEYIKYMRAGPSARREIIAEEFPGIESLAETSITLENYLLSQLALVDLPEKEKRIGEYLIQHIDERGYLKNFEEIIKKLKIKRTLAEKVLKVLQSFEPEGVGARDLKECLLIQVREYNFQNPELQKILEKVIARHLDDLGTKAYLKVAKALRLPEEGVAALTEFIKKNLNPNPGSVFGKMTPNIIPSFLIEKKGDQFEALNLEKNYGPILKINPEYLRLLEDPKTDQKTIEFLKEKMTAAKRLIEDISKRHETSEKILKIITQSQNSFFEKGRLYLKPLMQKNLAETLGVHPSTISRAISSKYIQTPQGLLPLKYLCPREYRGQAVEKIKGVIKDLVAKEDKEKPLSDSKIKEHLEESGIQIARRTVVKYRKQLKIASYRERKSLI